MCMFVFTLCVNVCMCVCMFVRYSARTYESNPDVFEVLFVFWIRPVELPVAPLEGAMLRRQKNSDLIIKHLRHRSLLRGITKPDCVACSLPSEEPPCSSVIPARTSGWYNYYGQTCGDYMPDSDVTIIPVCALKDEWDLFCAERNKSEHVAYSYCTTRLCARP